MTKEILRAENISKSFAGVNALKNVSLSLREGEILCLVGENGSGKSTMIKILSGVYTPDEGAIYINEHQYKKLTPIESIKEGVQVIYQDFSLFPNLSVAENLAINEQVTSRKQVVNWKEIRQIAREGLERIGIQIPLDEIAGSLSTADRQLIAITKALMADAKIIIMDEPTTALTMHEIQALFKIIFDLKKRGIATLFVSHKLSEIKEIADRTIIFRNGEKVLDQEASSLDIKTMEFHMTGRELSRIDFASKKVDAAETPLLSVRDLNLFNKFKDISFDLYKGEVLGITGLLGCGRAELALALFGEMPADSGRIILEGKEIAIRKIQDSVRHGFGYVPEDRVREGLFLERMISHNLAVTTIEKLLKPTRLIDNRAIDELVDGWIKKLGIKAASADLPIMSLSGGNQQRIVLAKWLASKPRILILNSPTVGVDVGSKADIHTLIRTLTGEGIGILLISDDIPELIRTCDRILLMRQGELARIFSHDEIDEEILNRTMIENNAEKVETYA